jgi:hypothetical protein
VILSILELTWLEVQYALVDSTIKNDPTDTDWIQNGAGRWVNHKYGFGLIDAEKAIENAKKYGPDKMRFMFNSFSLIFRD